ncbi:MAG: glucosamine-6-phosphate deaminase [Alphaproteobacteria bacterium]|nr:glucosamine-6-phosphate deaminase [Alphaproteobacteria bacterium]
MRVIIKKDYEEVSDWAATYIAYRINRARPTPDKPFVLGLPMGDTPKGVYKQLVELNHRGKLSFANVVIFCMNEFVGLDAKAPQSCHSYMHEQLLKYVDSKASNIYILDGKTKNYEKECENFELAIRQKGGIDLFVGGVGVDGHIAFNEPFSSLTSRTRVKTLTTETMKVKAKLFDNDINKVPHTVLTVGIGTIMSAKEVLILATGTSKARATKEAVEGSVNHRWAVSALQMHDHGIYLCDEEASSSLEDETKRFFKDIERNAY